MQVRIARQLAVAEFPSPSLKVVDYMERIFADRKLLAVVGVGTVVAGLTGRVQVPAKYHNYYFTSGEY